MRDSHVTRLVRSALNLLSCSRFHAPVMDDHSSRKGDNTVRHVRETTEPLLVRTRHSPPSLTPDSYCRVRLGCSYFVGGGPPRSVVRRAIAPVLALGSRGSRWRR